ncbi:MAG TPA: hypothetical protein VFL85_02850 [Candidatus Saccharimonadales bacterium]|nr:hypothetical protein [Candidatus Saccharimonadales bacterium]
MSSKSKTTTDHDVIKQWVEARGGKPANVQGTGGKASAGVLRIEFPGQGSDDQLDELSWEEFFIKFDANNLAFLYQDTTADGSTSRFYKFVNR